MNRRLILGFALLIGLGIAGYAAVVWATAPTPGISVENAKLLHLGMPRAELITLLGTPTSPQPYLDVWTAGSFTIITTYNSKDESLAWGTWGQMPVLERGQKLWGGLDNDIGPPPPPLWRRVLAWSGLL